LPKPRKPKPSFDIVPPHESIDTGWVYKSSDPEPPTLATPPASAAQPSVVAPPRSALESAVDWLSRPFAVAVVMALAPLPILRRRRRPGSTAP
jgi:hypothetical protein